MTAVCPLGSVTETECATLANNAGINMQTVNIPADVPSGCSQSTNNPGFWVFNTAASTTECQMNGGFSCFCESTDVHALSDLDWKTTLYVAQRTTTRLFLLSLREVRPVRSRATEPTSLSLGRVTEGC